MNVATWIAGLWPATAGVALLLLANPRQPATHLPADAPNAVLAPLPPAGETLPDGLYRTTRANGSIRLLLGAGPQSVRGDTGIFDASLQVGHGSAESLVVTFDLASLAPASDDQGPRQSFDSRLLAAFGSVPVGSMRLELRCNETEPFLGGAAHRVRWHGEFRWDRGTAPVEFFLWHARQGSDGLHVLGSFHLPVGALVGTQRPSPLWQPSDAVLTVGLDLRLRTAR